MTIQLKIGTNKTNNFWRLLLLILLILPTLRSFSTDKKINQELFQDIILKYVEQFPEIPNNSLKIEPIFEIQFVSTSDTIKFWVRGYIGGPSVIPPLKPGTQPPLNPLEQKGIIRINRQPFVIFDFKDSDGYNLYNPRSVKKNRLKKIKDIPYGYNAGLIIPESWLVAIFNGKIEIIEKSEPFKIQL